MQTPAARLIFGPFVLDIEQATLTRDGAPLTVQPQVLSGIRFFAESAGRLIRQDELYAALWPGISVTEDTLFQLIRKIRKTLGDVPRRPIYLETVPRQGYRFVATVRTAKAAPPRAPTLPAASLPLFGRQAELSALLEHVRAGVGLVMLSGAGGMGKSHLAAALCRKLSAEFDAVVAVDLQDEDSAAGFIHAVAAALEVPATDPSTEAVRDRIGRALASRGRLLLLLDDLDRLEDAARDPVQRWRAAAPEVVWLLTCRRPVALTAARRVTLGPLPPAGARSLFCARLLGRGERIAEDDPHLGALLKRLDHSPLAIELAAARTSVMGIEALTRRLDDRFRVLRERHGDRPARHRSLHACLAASWTRLEDEQRAALAALAVLPGAFELGTAEALLLRTGGLDGQPLDEDPLDLIDDLHRDALLQAEGSAAAGRRLKLLESVRAFVSTDAAVAPLQAKARRLLLPVLTERVAHLCRHQPMSQARILACSMLAQVLDPHPPDGELAFALWHLTDWLLERGPRVIAARALQRLEPIREQLQPAPRAAAALARLAFEDVEPEERRGLAEAAHRWATSAGRADLIFSAKLAAAGAHSQQIAAEEADIEALLGSATAETRRRDLADSIALLARYRMDQGHLQEGLVLLTDALERLPAGPPRATLLDLLGLAWLRSGDADTATTHYEAARAIHVALGWRRRECVDLINIGGAMVMAGRAALARDYLRQASEALPRIGERRMHAAVMINLAVQYLFDGDHAAALAALDRAAPLIEAEGLRAWTGLLAHNRATAFWLAGDLVAALSQADQGLAWCRETSAARQGGLLQAWRAGLLAALGDSTGAADALSHAAAGIEPDDSAATEALDVIRLHVAACHGPVQIPDRDWTPRGRQLVALLKRRLAAGAS